MNRLQVVNTVLEKLREGTVASTTENPYATMILQFVKETYDEIAKQAEWTWLRQQVTLTGAQLNAGYTYASKDQPNPNVIDLWDANLKYRIKKADSLKVAQFMAQVNPQVTGPAYMWYVAPYSLTVTDPTLKVWPRVPDTNVFTLTLEVMQDVRGDAVTDTTELNCPGFLLVLGAYEKALMERDGDTAQQQKAASAYTMAVASQVSMDNTLDRTATDWVPE